MHDVSSAHAAPPTPSSWATGLLVAVNVVVYLALMAKGGPTYTNLVLFGAKENGLIAMGELGRIFVPLFLHGGGLHLAFNMYALYQVGRALEGTLGSLQTLQIYLVSGLSGNLCSFALSPHLSVGASGSLFGFLLCLYVIKKYEERMARELHVQVPESRLGFLIAVNGVISFAIPNIDWACHLGGALAGTLLGAAFVAGHSWRVKVLSSSKYVGYLSQLPLPPLWTRPSFFVLLLAALNLFFALSFVNVTAAQKAFGLGVKQAAQHEGAVREASGLALFRTVLTAPSSDTGPSLLWNRALVLHRQKEWRAAVRVYAVVKAFAQADMLPDHFRGGTALFQIDAALKAAVEHQPLPQGLGLETSGSSPSEGPFSADKMAAHLAQSAHFLETLGFFSLGGQLHEAAFLVLVHNPVAWGRATVRSSRRLLPPSEQLDWAAQVVCSYWLGNSSQALTRFLGELGQGPQAVEEFGSAPDADDDHFSFHFELFSNPEEQRHQKTERQDF